MSDRQDRRPRTDEAPPVPGEFSRRKFVGPGVAAVLGVAVGAQFTGGRVDIRCGIGP
ncbi:MULTISPECIES: hypothetical protein [unclassified Streptomyces]|uniref:hypothetical protein n=1 Tax=unclassified Streptomyces TaxID=2593676 RepID=UPI0034302B8F